MIKLDFFDSLNLCSGFRYCVTLINWGFEISESKMKCFSISVSHNELWSTCWMWHISQQPVSVGTTILVACHPRQVTAPHLRIDFSFKYLGLPVSYNDLTEWVCISLEAQPGPLFTKKTPSYGYRNPHYKPETVWGPSQVYNGNPYTDKTASS